MSEEIEKRLQVLWKGRFVPTSQEMPTTIIITRETKRRLGFKTFEEIEREWSAKARFKK